MPCLALGRMSSGTDEQMYSRNRLRQCLHSELKPDSETNAKQSQSQSPLGIVLHHVKQRNLCAIPNKTIKLYFVTPNHKPNNTYLNCKAKTSVNILTSFTKKKNWNTFSKKSIKKGDEQEAYCQRSCLQKGYYTK